MDIISLFNTKTGKYQGLPLENIPRGTPQLPLQSMPFRKQYHFDTIDRKKEEAECSASP